MLIYRKSGRMSLSPFGNSLWPLRLLCGPTHYTVQGPELYFTGLPLPPPPPSSPPSAPGPSPMESPPNTDSSPQLRRGHLLSESFLTFRKSNPSPLMPLGDHTVFSHAAFNRQMNVFVECLFPLRYNRVSSTQESLLTCLLLGSL